MNSAGIDGVVLLGGFMVCSSRCWSGVDGVNERGIVSIESLGHR